jgi:hypothetical protein
MNLPRVFSGLQRRAISLYELLHRESESGEARDI